MQLTSGGTFLDQISQSSDMLFKQIRESAVRVEYSQTIQIKASLLITGLERVLKLALLITSSVTAGGLILDLAGCAYDAIMIAFFSILSVVLGSVINLADFRSLSDSHKRAADELWTIREEYRSLIVDYGMLSDAERRTCRNQLSEKTGKVYSISPPTGCVACFIAKRALGRGEQEITPAECDDFLKSS